MKIAPHPYVIQLIRTYPFSYIQWHQAEGGSIDIKLCAKQPQFTGTLIVSSTEHHVYFTAQQGASDAEIIMARPSFRLLTADIRDYLALKDYPMDTFETEPTYEQIDLLYMLIQFYGYSARGREFTATLDGGVVTVQTAGGSVRFKLNTELPCSLKAHRRTVELNHPYLEELSEYVGNKLQLVQGF